jgi:hypothetical protein
MMKDRERIGDGEEGGGGIAFDGEDAAGRKKLRRSRSKMSRKY